MYSSDTNAHVSSHVLRRITYVTCQTSHTYNTLPVQFSNFLPSSRVVAQISSLLATLLWKPTIYQRYNSIHVKKSLRPTLEYSWGGGVKGMLLPLVSRSVDPACFNISPLYQIISSHQFHQLTSYLPIPNENYVTITYVTLKAPGSEKNISWAPHRANWLAASQQQTTDIVLSGNAKKIIYNVFFVLSCNTFGLV